METYYIAGIPVADELYHYGIPDMRWGIRRYQNPDGTLTPAGKERYYGNRKSGKPSRIKQVAKLYGKNVQQVAKLYGKHVVNTIKKDHPWLMSDEELTAVLARMTLEQKVRNIRKDERSSRLVNRVLKEVGGFMITGIKDFSSNFNRTAGKNIADDLFGTKKSGKNKDPEKKPKKKGEETGEETGEEKGEKKGGK